MTENKLVVLSIKYILEIYQKSKFEMYFKKSPLLHKKWFPH